MAALITETTYGGVDALKLSNEVLTAVIIPDSGGKLASLRHSGNPDYEIMYQNPRLGVTPQPYAAPYEQSITGMDELFPMTGGGTYPDEPLQGVECPPKGEIWYSPMVTKVKGHSLEQQMRGTRFPYSFKRNMTLDGEALGFHYSVTNTGENPWKATWAVQPHMNLAPGSTLSVPGKANFLIDFSFDDKINDPEVPRTWPLALGKGGASANFAAPMKIDGGGEKLYLLNAEEKRITFANPESGLSVTTDFSDPMIPACGIWIDRGAWPEEYPDSLIAPGPSIGLSDGFETSLSKGMVLNLIPGEFMEWSWSLEVRKSR